MNYFETSVLSEDDVAIRGRCSRLIFMVMEEAECVNIYHLWGSSNYNDERSLVSRGGIKSPIWFIFIPRASK